MAVILDHNYGCLMTMLKYGSIRSSFWTQMAGGVAGGPTPMPYPYTYELLPEKGDAITLQPAENQTFDDSMGTLAGVTP